jgi:hypothetical protein
MEDKNITEEWLNFLNPDSLKENLIFSSLYIATYESFKDYIIETVKSFFQNGFKNDLDIISDDYNIKVLGKHKKIITANLLFLKDLGALNDDDLKLFDELTNYRNELAHRLMNLIFKGVQNDLPVKFKSLIDLKIKIEKWWILNIEIPISEQFKSDDIIKEDDIISSSQLFFQIILDMLSEDKEKSFQYLKELKNKLNID